MTIGELLDSASRLYVRNFSLLLSISALVHIPSTILEFLRASRNATGTRATLLGATLQLIAILISFFAISPLTGGTAAQAVSDIYLGNEVTLRGALGAAWSKYRILVKSHFLALLLILAGVLMLLVPGILWYLSYVFITPIVMIEGMSGSFG